MKTRLILVITPLLLIILALAGGSTLAWRFGIFLVVVFGLSYLWPRLTGKGITGSSKLIAGEYQVGRAIEQEFTVNNQGWIPTPLIEVDENTDLPGYHNVVTFSLASKGDHSWKSRFVCQRRGEYYLGDFTVKVTDPLGFFPVSHSFGKRKNIVVYPWTVDLPFFDALPLQEPGLSPRRWLASEAGPNASRVREYVSGDRLRHISWQTTAHTGTLMVKEFDPDHANYSFKNLWIVLDMHRKSHHGEGDDGTEEYAISIAASLARKYLEAGKNVGLMASAEIPHLFLPKSGKEHLKGILRTLATMRATGNVVLETMLKWEIERFGTDSVVVIISPSRDSEIGPLMRRVVKLGTVVTAILLDSRSFGGEIEAGPLVPRLNINGIHAYVVKRGMEIARALDNRLLATPASVFGEQFTNAR